MCFLGEGSLRPENQGVWLGATGGKKAYEGADGEADIRVRMVLGSVAGLDFVKVSYEPH